MNLSLRDVLTFAYADRSMKANFPANDQETFCDAPQ